MTDEIYSSEGNVFIQTAPDAAYEFLTCTDVGDIATPKGGRTTFYKPDVRRSGKFVASGSVEGQPGQITTTLTKPLSSVKNYLIELKCPPNIRINWVCRGERNSVTNYQVAAILFDAGLTGGGIQKPVVAGDPAAANTRVTTSGEIGATSMTLIYPLTGTRQTLTSTTAAYAIAFRPEECASKCGDRVEFVDDGWIGLESDAYTVGYLLHSTDGGSSWAAPAGMVDVFGDAGDVRDILIVETYDGYRVIVCRGSADGANHAEVSYSDDAGVTWVNVDVGAVDGAYLMALTRDLSGYVWTCGSGGYIYRSDNQGQTWTAMESGVETVQVLNDIQFYTDLIGYCVGGNNAFLRTLDGTTWDAVTGPSVGSALTTVAINASGHVYVGSETGAIYRSVDKGANWTTVVDLGTGHVEKIRFDPDMGYIGFAIYNSATPVGTLYRSEDGGVSWRAQTTPTNAGLNNLFVGDANTCFVCGNAQGGTTYVAKFTKSS